jgi:ABC-type Fe3+/spermidine/putrescine transport system ATPase subunit
MIVAGNQPILRIRGLTKRYGAFTALAGIDLDVARGELVALLGPSGCGKSTTLMAVAGFVEPDSGSIELAGKDITRLVPEQRSMGVVFQDYALFPHVTVLENVAFPLRMRGIGRREREEKALGVLEQVRLPQKCIRAHPNELSGGQRQRVAVARALVFDPVMLLMDEPLAALDRRLRQHLQYELRHLQDRLGTTVIYVTHDQEEALVLADRIVVMREGQFEQIGSPCEVYERPANAFVASFLGESNSLPVSVVRRDDGSAVARYGNHETPITVATAMAARGVLVIRPERLRIEKRRPEGDGPALPARVIDVAFLGDRLRAELLLFDSVSWTASIPTGEAGRGADLLERGAEVTVSWSPADARLLPDVEI